MNTYQQILADDQQLVENWLESCFDGREEYARLYESMKYSLLAGGKRIRPILVLESCRLFGGDVTAALPFACGVEMLHTYSLIHDDLPCMDNDSLRRGKPTNHILFGEAGAVLAGDALLTAAFETMLDNRGSFTDNQVLQAAACLGKAAGARGMVGGQSLDMAAEGQRLNETELTQLQRLKTGALIAAAAEIGCILAGGSDEQRKNIRLYAEKIGLAFQIQDDILDITGDTQRLGKTVGSDAENAKSTFVTCLGLDECKKRVQALTQQAEAAIADYDGSGFLIWLGKYLAGRDY